MTNLSPTPGRIGILGAGAMGTLFGARLASAGVPVSLVDVNETLLATLRREGARCMTDEGLLQAPVEALRADQLQTGPDRWLVFTKSAHTAAALQSIAHLIGPATHFLSLQNGIGHAEVLQRFAPASRVAVGVTTWPARLLGPGEVSSLGQGGIRFMACDGRANPVFEQLAQDLNAAGLNSRIDPDVQAAIWEKLAFNAAFNGICALSGQTVDGLANSMGEPLLEAALEEALAVAHADGVNASGERVRAAVRDALDHHQGHQPSMLQDLLAGRATEVEAIHGAVLRAAESHGLPTPVIRTLYQLIHLRERAAHQPA
ncbi:ketopantoate reductase family protein [Variovorax sp. GB1P17]|uniref:ketopantoate reductase family protein n=1 Tax=Variovorax sp. GB1P17 TaxID=3443740 RepID=UPI003F481CFB